MVYLDSDLNKKLNIEGINQDILGVYLVLETKDNIIAIIHHILEINFFKISEYKSNKITII